MSEDKADVTALLAVEEGSALTHYLPTGKKKNVRHFWVSIDQATISWDKKKGAKPNKTAPLLGVHSGLKSPRQWFDIFDVDGSGSLDASQLATLYRTAREEQLSKKDLKAALAAMDTDGSGAIEFAEFEAWWRSTGGELEKLREHAFTVVAGDAQMLLVAPDVATKNLWVRGLTATLSIKSSLAAGNAPEPEPEPRLSQETILPSPRTKEDIPSSTESTPAWWLDHQAQHSAVSLSPGSVQQLSVWAKVHSRETKAEQPSDSVPASGDEQGQPASNTRKSHDGYGAHPVKSIDPCTHPTHDSTGAPISALPTEAKTATDNPESSSSGTAPVGKSTASVIASRHHAQDSTMQAVTSFWRSDETSSLVVESSASTLGDPHVTATPRGDCFDKGSNHHPEGHWHQANQEGDFSAHLSAHFMSRDSTGAVHVETGGSMSSSKSSIRGASSVSGSPSIHPVVEAERKLAGLVDHGRGCHSPKYLGSDHHKDGHGLNGHERGHRPLPWDTHSYAAPAGLKPYQKSHHKSTVHGEYFTLFVSINRCCCFPISVLQRQSYATNISLTASGCQVTTSMITVHNIRLNRV
jgi:hypothetical protein